MKLLTFSLLMLVFACTAPAEKTLTVVSLTPQELSQLLLDDEVTIIDVRTEQEVAQGIIENARHLDFYDDAFATKINELSREKPVALYCASGMRSARAAAQLLEMGFTEVYDLKGGIRDWQIAGYEIIKAE